LRRINVLHLINEIEPAGAETLLLNTVRHFDKQRFNLLVCYFTGPGTLADETRAAGAEVIDFSKEGKVDPLFLPKLISFVWERQIDIIHTHLNQATLIGRLVAKLMGIRPILSTRHYAYDHKEKGLVRRLERWSASVDSMILAVSKPVRDHLVSKDGCSSERIEVLTNAIDVNAFTVRDYVRPTVRTPWAPVIGAVGRLHPSKGYDTLLKTAEIVLKELPAVRFKIVGGGELLRDLKVKAEQLGISEAVEFLGQKQPAEIPDILTGFDVFVQASNWEAFGIAIVEAMACGLPVVATEVEGVLDVVDDGVNGFLVPPRDPKALAERIIALCDDPELRRRIGDQAHRKAESHFDIRVMTDKLASVYLDLLNGARWSDFSGSAL
jgi:glycosyltransferase involved in cell wall biosynthesis